LQLQSNEFIDSAI